MMRPKTLTRSEENDLIRAFHSKFKDKGFKSHAQLWWEVVMDWLSWRYEGADLITRSVRDQEIKVLQQDSLCKEYISALMKICIPDSNEMLSEHQKLVLIMSASSDEREEALHLIRS